MTIRKARMQLRQVIILCLAIITTLVFLVPVLWALLTALKFHRDVFTFPPTFIFVPTLSNFTEVLRESDYLNYMFNSIIVSTLASIISVFVGTLAAFGFTRFRIRGSGHILLWILSLRMIPPIAVLVPFYFMAINTGLYDTRVGLAIILVVTTLPLAVWLQMSFIREIPPAIEEAAMVDGCSPFGALIRVVVPLEIPGIIATFIVCVIFAWNEFPLSLVIAPHRARTLPVSMVSWDTPRGLLWGQMMASGLMAVIPIIVIAIFVQKYIVRGLTLGSITDE